ncbi:MAG: T9SS type A sorting domain-containing protein [Chitinophagaceae bacterium]
MKVKYFFLMLVMVTLSVVAKANTWVIQVANFQFSPANVNVIVGDTVKWVWVDGTHTTTSTSLPGGAAAWDSPINTTTTSFSYKVTIAGTYNYWCTIHAPSMAGVITATGTLPVVLSAFNIIPTKPDGTALISWTTATEINTDLFIVNKSVNGISFSEISRVKAAGNSSTPQTYTATDNNNGSPFKYIYYELQIIDKDGTSTLSSIQKFINNSVAKKLITQLSPNPITAPGHLMFQFNAEKNGSMKIQLYNTAGKLIKEDNANAITGLNNGHFHMGALPAGVYTIVFTLDNERESYQVMMQ